MISTKGTYFHLNTTQFYKEGDICLAVFVS